MLLFPGVPPAVIPAGREGWEGEGLTPRHGSRSDRGTVPVGGGSGRARLSPAAPLSLPTEFPMTVSYSLGLGRPSAFRGRRRCQRGTMLLMDRAGPGWGRSQPVPSPVPAQPCSSAPCFSALAKVLRGVFCASRVFLYADDVVL